jgi:hypothetical protein
VLAAPGLPVIHAYASQFHRGRASGRDWYVAQCLEVDVASLFQNWSHAALAEHLAARHDLAPPDWADLRVLRRPWFPAELEIQRADALVWAPAAFRKHGVYLSAKDPEAG